MCGIAGIFCTHTEPRLLPQLEAMVRSQRHRGPDDSGRWINEQSTVALGHNRLSILDLSPAGHQPMWNQAGTLVVVFNGEIYNYLELRAELNDYRWTSRTDTEVVLAAWERWGSACLNRFIGMFAFLLWDTRSQTLFAARDRFGVKPLYYNQGPHGQIHLASEIKALQEVGAGCQPDAETWANYLSLGLCDYSDRTFWEGVRNLPGGHLLTWQNGSLAMEQWYDLAGSAGDESDGRPEAEVASEYRALLEESVRLRFRSDVAVGINLSGGLDSSSLLGVVHAVQGAESQVRAYTFVTGDSNYDELPWVRQMLQHTKHPLEACRLSAQEVPELAESVQRHQDEPFGGLPTLAYARLFESARADGVIVLLDGQGMDEQWAGYGYYAAALRGETAGLVQGTSEAPVRPECLTPEFAERAKHWAAPRPFRDVLRNTQYRDALHTKIPRALRYNDRISMRVSTELREPFLDHRLVELAFRQPADRKIRGGVSKWLLRQIAAGLAPNGIVEAPKRPLQTPQREWLRGPLRPWAEELVEAAVERHSSWLIPGRVRAAWRAFQDGASDNSFYVWQWLSLALLSDHVTRPTVSIA